MHFCSDAWRHAHICSGLQYRATAAITKSSIIQGFDKYKGVSNNAWSRNASTLFYLQSKNAMNHPEILDILKKHNYYGFSFLKNYIESGELENEIPSTTQGDEY